MISGRASPAWCSARNSGWRPTTSKSAASAPTKTLVLADQDLVYQVHLQSGGQRYQVLQCGRGDPFFRHTEQGRRYVACAHRRGYCARGAALCVRPLLQGRQKPWAEHTGSGLGLHICKVLINLSGGKIWVDSKEGEYCEFLFTLPAPPSSPIKGGKLKDQ